METAHGALSWRGGRSMGGYLGEKLSGPAVGQLVWGVLGNFWITAKWALSYFSEYFLRQGPGAR